MSNEENKNSVDNKDKAKNQQNDKKQPPSAEKSNGNPRLVNLLYRAMICFCFPHWYDINTSGDLVS
jgi:hypothetical protein